MPLWESFHSTTRSDSHDYGEKVVFYEFKIALVQSFGGLYPTKLIRVSKALLRIQCRHIAQ